MRKYLFLMFALAVSMSSLADIKEVELNSNNNDETSTKDHRSVAPTVNYDEKNVWIKSKELIPDANIVIKDAGNKVIYQGSMPLSPSASVISLPVDNDKYSIELSYGKKNFSGFFVE